MGRKKLDKPRGCWNSFPKAESVQRRRDGLRKTAPTPQAPLPMRCCFLPASPPCPDALSSSGRRGRGGPAFQPPLPRGGAHSPQALLTDRGGLICQLAKSGPWLPPPQSHFPSVTGPVAESGTCQAAASSSNGRGWP